MTTELAVISKDESRALAPPEIESTAGYAGASMLQMNDASSKALGLPFGDEALDVKPTGEVYVSHVHYRRRLNQVFGPGQWALVPRDKWKVEGNTMMREYALFIRGHFIAEAMGEQEYIPENDRMTWADAAEGCKSNALTRACKDLGIASECWDRQFAEGWRSKHCIQVWVKNKNKPQWRRKNAPKFYNEGNPVDQADAPRDRDDRPASRQSSPPPKPEATAPAQTRDPGEDDGPPPGGPQRARIPSRVDYLIEPLRLGEELLRITGGRAEASKLLGELTSARFTTVRGMKPGDVELAWAALAKHATYGPEGGSK